MKEAIQDLEMTTLAAIAAADDERALDEVRVAVLGKKGSLTAMAAGMRDVPADRKAAGRPVAERRAAGHHRCAGRAESGHRQGGGPGIGGRH